ELILELPDLEDFFWGERIGRMTASPDGAVLAISGVSDSVYLWDLRSRSLIRTFVPRVGNHLEGIYGMEFHATLPYFAFIERHGSVSLVSTHSWMPTVTWDFPDDPAIAIAFARKKDLLAIGQQSGRVTVWSIGERRELISEQFGEFIFSLSFSPD